MIMWRLQDGTEALRAEISDDGSELFNFEKWSWHPSNDLAIVLL